MSKKISTFCTLPWRHLATHPNGHTSLCCQVDMRTNAGQSVNTPNQFLNLDTHSINELMNSDHFKKARLQMLQGIWPEACSLCQSREEQGLASKRMIDSHYLPFSEDMARQQTNHDGSITPQLHSVELRLGNLCNLKCRTCNPFSSSALQRDFKDLRKNLDFVRPYDLTNTSFEWINNPAFWEELLSHHQEIKILHINGGEPTMIKQHWEFLEKLIKLDAAKNISIKYNTNLTFLPKNAVDIWEKFQHVLIGVSIDDVGQRNDYIRIGSQWSRILANLEKIKNGPFTISIQQTVGAMNCYHADSLYEWTVQQGLNYEFHFVRDPEYLSTSIFPEIVKEKILKKLSKTLPEKILAVFRAELQSPTTNPETYQQFVKYTHYLDQKHEMSFKATFPEFYELLQNHQLDF